MATESDSNSVLESFFESASIEIDHFGEPPLANSEDTLLDRDRIHLDLDLNDE